MVKRKTVVDLLRKSGLHPTGGSNHEHWTDGTHWTQVPKHREISEQLFKRSRNRRG